MKTKYATINDVTVQHDRSCGQGHCWRTVASREDTSADVWDEVETEIIETGDTQRDDYIACNGEHYRWSPRK